MSDIVKRLQSPEVFISTGGMYSPVAHEAAAEITRLRAALATARREGMEAVNALAVLEVWAKKGKIEIARSLLGKGFEVGHLATNSVGVGETVMDAIRAAAKEGK